MVLILVGNSETGAHVRSNHCYSICQRHLIISKADADLFFLVGIVLFSSCVRNMIPFIISTMFSRLKSVIGRPNLMCCRSNDCDLHFMPLKLCPNFYSFLTKYNRTRLGHWYWGVQHFGLVVIRYLSFANFLI